MTIDGRLRELGIELPQVLPPAGNYVAAVRTGSLLYTSGAGPVRPDGSIVTGKVGADLDIDAAVEAARLTGLQLLAAARAELGSLDRVRRVVKTFGMVNGAPGFNRTPQVIDGCSNLLVAVFGDAGRGPARRSVRPSSRSTSPWRSSSSSRSPATSRRRAWSPDERPLACAAMRTMAVLVAAGASARAACRGDDDASLTGRRPRQRPRAQPHRGRGDEG